MKIEVPVSVDTTTGRVSVVGAGLSPKPIL